MTNTTLRSPYDGLELHLLVSEPESKPVGIVQMVHGMCEHKERYGPFMEYLSANGYLCVMHDHRGHGLSVQSADDLGHIRDYRALIDDTIAVTNYILEKYPELPIYLLGHSMGSMVVRSCVKRNDSLYKKLLVVGCPSVNRFACVGKVFARIDIKLHGGHSRSKFLQQISTGAFSRKFRHEASPNAYICSDPEIVAAYDRDSLCGFMFTSRGYYNLFSLMQDCYACDDWAMTNPEMPVRFFSGKEDPCLGDMPRFRASVEAMEKVGYHHVSSKLYLNMRHEILNENGKEQVWGDILDFIGNGE